jgi:hypothetical protein
MTMATSVFSGATPGSLVARYINSEVRVRIVFFLSKNGNVRLYLKHLQPATRLHDFTLKNYVLTKKKTAHSEMH